VGKSTAAINDTTVSADVSLDGTQANLKRARERIQKALKHGHEVVFRFVHQDPTIALFGSIDRASEDFRTVPAKDAAEANAVARETLFELQSEFANEPRVMFKVIDHSQEGGPTLTVSEFAARPYEALSVDRAVRLAQKYIRERHPNLPANAEARILGRSRGYSGQTSQRGAPSGGQEVGTSRASGSGSFRQDGGDPATGQSGGFRNTDVIGRRQDGSTILFGELVNLAAGAVQAGVAFARWAADMVSRFGAGVRRYLQGAWQAASKTSQQGFFHPGDLPDVIRTRLGLQQNAPFRVNQLAARDLLLGSPLPAELVPLVAGSEREAKAVEQTAAQLARDLQAAEQAAVTQRGRNGDILHGYVTGFLNGVPAAGAVLQAMDDVTYQRARRMRNFIDDLSAEVAATLPVGPLRNALVNNMGAWLRRSYAAFDQVSGWNFDNLMRAAERGQQVGGRPALDVLRRGAAFLSQQGGYGANQRTANGITAIPSRGGSQNHGSMTSSPPGRPPM
jgi:hypothetical protein